MLAQHVVQCRIYVAVAAALAGTGCFKSIGYETFYVLRPWAQEGTVKTPIPREDMLAYAFDADTTEWSVLSYEDAVAGIITSRRTGEKLRPIAQGEPYEIDGNENWLAMQLNGPRFLILAVDQSNRLYGFTEQAIGENLPQMHVSVTFYPKEKGKRFLKGKWIMCNDFYTEPEPEPDPDPENPDTPDNPDNPNNPTIPVRLTTRIPRTHQLRTIPIRPKIPTPRKTRMCPIIRIRTLPTNRQFPAPARPCFDNRKTI